MTFPKKITFKFNLKKYKPLQPFVFKGEVLQLNGLQNSSLLILRMAMNIIMWKMEINSMDVMIKLQ